MEEVSAEKTRALGERSRPRDQLPVLPPFEPWETALGGLPVHAADRRLVTIGVNLPEC